MSTAELHAISRIDKETSIIDKRLNKTQKPK